MASMQEEEPYRLHSQLLSLARSLAVIWGHQAVTEEDVSLVEQVVVDTIEVDCGDALRTLLAKGNSLRSDLQKALSQSYGTIDRMLREFEHVGLVECVEQRQGGKGAPSDVFALTQRSFVVLSKD